MSVFSRDHISKVVILCSKRPSYHLHGFLVGNYSISPFVLPQLISNSKLLCCFYCSCMKETMPSGYGKIKVKLKSCLCYHFNPFYCQ